MIEASAAMLKEPVVSTAVERRKTYGALLLKYIEALENNTAYKMLPAVEYLVYDLGFGVYMNELDELIIHDAYEILYTNLGDVCKPIGGMGDGVRCEFTGYMLRQLIPQVPQV
jgi:hypothetical protein